MLAILCPAQSRDVLCSNGSGNFEAEFHTGVKLRLGAAKRNKGGLATRVCEATLSWDKQEIVITEKASLLDVDLFGADLGVGALVVAFQIKNSDSDCCMAYQIYSLQKPPRLLRTITGGGFFNASDKDLDGRVEIWTDDAAAVDGFENMVVGEFDFTPTLVLRFEHGRLLDVGSEFRPYFEKEIAKLRAELDSQDLRDFKDSDGRLASVAYLSAQRIHQLRGVKIKVLEIVWAYLYSSREPEAWRSLEDMWPASDVERIRAAILGVRARGIHSQVEGTSSGPSSGRKKRAVIFDTTNKPELAKSDIVPPQAILMRRPAPLAAGQGLPDSELLMDLLIDSAGKVRSAEPAGNVKFSDDSLVKAAMEWTFIPAFKNGSAVASRLRLAVSAKR